MRIDSPRLGPLQVRLGAGPNDGGWECTLAIRVYLIVFTLGWGYDIDAPVSCIPKLTRGHTKAGNWYVNLTWVGMFVGVGW